MLRTNPSGNLDCFIARLAIQVTGQPQGNDICREHDKAGGAGLTGLAVPVAALAVKNMQISKVHIFSPVMAVLCATHDASLAIKRNQIQ